jgi:hypothetical protein
MNKLDELEAAIQRCDNLDWRIDYDEDAEEWYAWFHPDWEADPRRVIRVILADDEPSANEQACIQAMQLVLANAPAMMGAIRAARQAVINPNVITMRDLGNALSKI